MPRPRRRSNRCGRENADEKRCPNDELDWRQCQRLAVASACATCSIAASSAATCQARAVSGITSGSTPWSTRARVDSEVNRRRFALQDGGCCGRFGIGERAGVGKLRHLVELEHPGALHQRHVGPRVDRRHRHSSIWVRSAGRISQTSMFLCVHWLGGRCRPAA